MSAKKVARFSVFSQYQTQPSPSQRFVSNILFDRNVLGLIEEFIVFPVDHHKWNIKLEYSLYAHKICFNLLSGDLWVSGDKHITIYKTDKDLKPINYIQCKGIPTCIHSIAHGLMVISECSPTRIMVYDVNATRYDQIGRDILISTDRLIDGIGLIGVPFGVAINHTSRQIAITEWDTSCIYIYSLNGSQYRTLQTKVNRPHGLCWNEKDSLLYVSSVNDYLVHVIDVKNDKRLDTWGDKSPAKLNYPSNMLYNAYTQELLVNDQNNKRIVVFDSAGVPIKVSSTNPFYRQDFIFHCDDVFGQVLITSHSKGIYLEKLNDFICL